MTYWYWRDPRDGVEKSLQCPNDRATAIKRARELNALVAVARADQIVAGLTAKSERRKDCRFDAFALNYLSRLQKRQAQGKIAANTLRSRKSLVNGAIDHFGARSLLDLAEDVAAISAFIVGIEESGRARLAQAMRSMLTDLNRVIRLNNIKHLHGCFGKEKGFAYRSSNQAVMAPITL